MGALNRFFGDKNGPVVRDLMVRGEHVKAEAKRLVGVYTPQPGIPRDRAPGTLRESIVKRLDSEAGLPVVFVGSNDPIALLHHEGTRPHEIRPKRPEGRLVFYSRKAGRIVVVRRVDHPGTRPNKYLANALPAARQGR